MSVVETTSIARGDDARGDGDARARFARVRGVARETAGAEVERDMGRGGAKCREGRADVRHDTRARDVELFPHHGLEA